VTYVPLEGNAPDAIPRVVARKVDPEDSVPKTVMRRLDRMDDDDDDDDDDDFGKEEDNMDDVIGSWIEDCCCHDSEALLPSRVAMSLKVRSM